MRQAYRHGEVFLVPIKKMPDGKAKKLKKLVVAHSESGRHHTLVSQKPFEVMENDDQFFIRLTWLLRGALGTLTATPCRWRIIC